MPLHIDRSTVAQTAAQRREWLLEKSKNDDSKVGGQDAASEPQVDSVVEVSGLSAGAPAQDLKNVNAAEDFVRALRANPAGLKAAHGAPDPARVAQLIGD